MIMRSFNSREELFKQIATALAEKRNWVNWPQMNDLGFALARILNLYSTRMGIEEEMKFLVKARIITAAGHLREKP